MSKRQPTAQQQACIAAAIDDSIQMLKIEACAGAGKTSTLGMMAEAKVAPSLYLAFNRVTADDAAQKFPKHVQCRTTHSIAYEVFGAKIRDKLSRPKGRYVNVAGTGSEIGLFYKMPPIEMSEHVFLSQAYLGLLVKFTVMRFEQSADAEIDVHHLPRGELFDIREKSQASTAYVEMLLLNTAKMLWKDRINPRSPVLATHDTYLKMYQLSKPVLHGVSVLYVDEFQDTTPCVLDIILNQEGNCKIIMVGDARQSIYQWRGAVNAMQLVKCESRSLTKSFRYGQAVADIATTVLQRDLVITGNEKIQSKCAESELIDRSKPYTRLFRTNGMLLSAAIGEIMKGTAVSIEIDVKDFVKLMESAIALYRNDKKKVKHDKLLPFKNFDEMLAEGKHDFELARIGKLVKDGLAEEWIDILLNFENSIDPHVTFTTAHKSKGREWSQVMLESDFKSCYGEEGWNGLPEEEQNLLYVACTRAIDVLEYNSTVVEYLDYAAMNDEVEELAA